jgi:hypothetical protein
MESIDKSFTDVGKGLHDLFKYAYLTNCELEAEALT